MLQKKPVNSIVFVKCSQINFRKKKQFYLIFLGLFIFGVATKKSNEKNNLFLFKIFSNTVNFSE